MNTQTAQAREALVRHAYAMGGRLAASAVHGLSEWAALMPDLVREGVFEYQPRVPGVRLERYALTGAGKTWAEGL